MKKDGQWPLSWTSAIGLVPLIQELGDEVVKVKSAVTSTGVLTFIHPMDAWFVGIIGPIGEPALSHN